DGTTDVNPANGSPFATQKSGTGMLSELRRSLVKTIGVLGGMGPDATVEFERRVHEIARGRVPPRGNTGYPPMIVYYYRRLPVVVREDGSPVLPLQPRADFLEAARWLAERADFLVIAANAPHLFAEQIEQAAGRKLLSMIEAALAEVRRR